MVRFIFGGSKHPNTDTSIVISLLLLYRYENRNGLHTFSQAWPSVCLISRRALAATYNFLKEI